MRFSFFRNIILGLAEGGLASVLYNGMENLLHKVYEGGSIPVYQEKFFEENESVIV